jgi:predicted GIY-YIG superfamily endonuclease
VLVRRLRGSWSTHWEAVFCGVTPVGTPKRPGGRGVGGAILGYLTVIQPRKIKIKTLLTPLSSGAIHIIMKNIPDPIPYGQGLYVLAHEPSKSLYVGSSTNLKGRAYEWKAALKAGKFEHPVDEWEFRLIKRTENMTYQQLRDAELKLMDMARSRGFRLLNRMSPQTHHRFTLDGIEGSATFHACRLGKNPSHVIGKLKRGYTPEQALGLTTSPHDPRESAIAQMPTKITHEGKPITYEEAANILGCQRDTIRERAKRLRRKTPDLTEIPLNTLR